MDRVAPRLQSVMERMFFTDTVTIAHEVSPDVWQTAAARPASVQHLREQPAPRDPVFAKVATTRALIVYTSKDADVAVGDRMPWDGATWEITSVTPTRGVGVYTRFVVEQEQIGTPLETVSFRRRVSGAWQEMGTFTVRRTQDQREPNALSRASVFDASTALGAEISGVLSGGADLAVIDTGDWFDLDKFPGRVISVDRTNEDRTLVAYRMEQRAAR